MEAPIVHILYQRLDFDIPQNAWEKLVSELSSEQVARMQRFHFWKDQLRYLVGKLLVRRILHVHGYAADLSHQLLKSAYDRPYLDLPLDFNLSHSGNCVVGAGSVDCRLGIDTEAYKEIEFEHFESTMTPGQWAHIQGASDPKMVFFHYWAMKESIIKADGRGLSLPLSEIEIVDMQVHDRNVTWHLRELDLDPGHPAYVATDAREVELVVREVDLIAEQG